MVLYFTMSWCECRDVAKTQPQVLLLGTIYGPFLIPFITWTIKQLIKSQNKSHKSHINRRKNSLHQFQSHSIFCSRGSHCLSQQQHCKSIHLNDVKNECHINANDIPVGVCEWLRIRFEIYESVLEHTATFSCKGALQWKFDVCWHQG